MCGGGSRGSAPSIQWNATHDGAVWTVEIIVAGYLFEGVVFPVAALAFASRGHMKTALIFIAYTVSTILHAGSSADLADLDVHLGVEAAKTVWTVWAVVMVAALVVAHIAAAYLFQSRSAS